MKNRILFQRKYGIAFMIIGIWLITVRSNLTFATLETLVNQFSLFSLVVCGVFLSSIAGEMNASSGSLISFVSVLVTALHLKHIPLSGIVSISFLGMIVLSQCYGMIRLFTRIHPLILSLVMTLILNGISHSLQNSFTTASYFNGLSLHLDKSISGIPLPLIISISFILVISFFFRYTFPGRVLVVVGSNPEEAERSGIPVNVVRLLAYSLSFIPITMAALLLFSRTNIGDYRLGSSYNYDAIAALCIGRVNLNGGKGSITGALLGVVAMILLNSLLVISELRVPHPGLITGTIILLMLYGEMKEESKM